MVTTSQVCMVLLNIYINMLVLSPLWQSYKTVRYNQVTSSIGFGAIPESMKLEAEIDAIMNDYVKHLRLIKNIENDEQALAAISQARVLLSKRIEKLIPEIKAWKQFLSAQEARLFTEKLLVKPYFKEINDLTFAYNLSKKGTKNTALLKAYQSLNECIPALYN